MIYAGRTGGKIAKIVKMAKEDSNITVIVPKRYRDIFLGMGIPENQIMIPDAVFDSLEKGGDGR